MSHLPILFCLLFAVGASVTKVHAADPRYQSLLNLSNDPVWHALLHYEADSAGGIAKSAISTSSFFLSADGHHDAYAELTTTIDAFLLPVVDADSHARCLYPSRFHWLKDRVERLADLTALKLSLIHI